MVSVEFVDNSKNVREALERAIIGGLEEAAGELESQVKRNSRVKSRQTSNSFQHKVDDASHIAYIGSNYENAIWEEFGTGEHALHGDGRKGGWAYQDPKTGETIWKHGKKPSRAFWNAYTSMKNKLIKLIQNKIRRDME